MSDVIEKEFVYLPKHLAKQLEQLDSAEGQERAVKKIIEQKRLDLQDEFELLQESLLVFKSVALSHRNELKKVYDDENEKLQGLWESLGDTRKTLGEHSKKLAEELHSMRHEVDSLKKNITELQKALGSLRVHDVDKVLQLAEQLTCMDEATKKLMRVLVNQ